MTNFFFFFLIKCFVGRRRRDVLSGCKLLTENKRKRESCIHSTSSIMLGKVKVTDRGHSVGFESFRCPAVFAVVTARCSSHVVPVKKNGGSDGELKMDGKFMKNQAGATTPIVTKLRSVIGSISCQSGFDTTASQ